VTLHGARTDAHELGCVLDGSASGDEGCEHIHLALGRRSRELAAQVPVLHAKRFAAAASHSSRPSMGMLYLGPEGGRAYADPARRPPGFVIRLPMSAARAWDLADRL